MGMYALREISLRNYDSALEASPLGRYHNSFMIFFVAHTPPYINNYLLQGRDAYNRGDHACNMAGYTLTYSHIHKNGSGAPGRDAVGESWRQGG